MAAVVRHHPRVGTLEVPQRSVRLAPHHAVRYAEETRMRIAAVLILPLIAIQMPAQSPAGIPGVVAAGAQPELVQEGFVFTEGPVGAADGGLFFSDVRAKRIYRLDPSGKITPARENTNGANGLALNSGELYA